MLVRIELAEKNSIETDLHHQSVWLGALHNYLHHPSPLPTWWVWKEELLIYIPFVDCLRTVLWLSDCPTLMLSFPLPLPMFSHHQLHSSITARLLCGCRLEANICQTSRCSENLGLNHKPFGFSSSPLHDQTRRHTSLCGATHQERKKVQRCKWKQLLAECKWPLPSIYI